MWRQDQEAVARRDEDTTALLGKLGAVPGSTCKGYDPNGPGEAAGRTDADPAGRTGFSGEQPKTSRHLEEFGLQGP
jgi:hypothetical protein